MANNCKCPKNEDSFEGIYSKLGAQSSSCLKFGAVKNYSKLAQQITNLINLNLSIIKTAY